MCNMWLHFRNVMTSFPKCCLWIHNKLKKYVEIHKKCYILLLIIANNIYSEKMKSKGFLNKYDILKPFIGRHTAIEYNNKLWIHIGKVIHICHEYKASIYIFFIWKYKQDYITIPLVFHTEWSALSFWMSFWLVWGWITACEPLVILDGIWTTYYAEIHEINMSSHSFELRRMS